MVGFEIRYHPHIHTRFSDGHGTFQDVVQAAAQAGLHVLHLTDHNILVREVEGYYHPNGRPVLLLVGQELHNPDLQPEGNHLLALGASRDLASLIHEPPQRLIDAVREHQGLSFIAHPIDFPVPFANEGYFPWRDWDVTGFHGIELWNAMSEFKRRLRSPLHALYYAFRFHRVARGPFPETLQLWDRLIQQHQRPIVAIGGSDAHALPARMGPLRRTLFPYVCHFRAVNTHLLLERPLVGDLEQDRQQVLQALRAGHAFVGYDLPAPTDGFRFWAQNSDQVAWMGDTLPFNGNLTLHIHLPRRATLTRLIRNGSVLRTWHYVERIQWPVRQPGVYRVEVYLRVWGRLRGWIFSNPIYIVP